MPEQVIYTGYFVTQPDELLRQIPPLIIGEDFKVYAHHVTIEYRPSNGIEGTIPGRTRTLYAIGQVASSGVHAVLVEAQDGESISSNEYPHLTIATAKGVPPVKSNEVIARAVRDDTIEPIEPPIPFEVIEGYFNGQQVRKS